ncbi:MAG TPA: hypothetical protein VEH53_00590 [archaeon]|nr:hypothetical protein [archaeon]
MPNHALLSGSRSFSFPPCSAYDPLQSARLRWEHAIRDQHGSPPVPDLLSVETGPDGVIVSTEGGQAAGAYLSWVP